MSHLCRIYHGAKYNSISNQLAEGTLPPLSTKLLCDYNRLVLEKLPAKDDVKPGESRSPFHASSPCYSLT